MKMVELIPGSWETKRWRLSGRELFLIFFFWTALATLSSVNRLLDPRGFGLRLMSPAGPILMVYLESWIWAAVTPLIFYLSSRVTMERSRWVSRGPFLLLIGLAISVGIFFILAWVRFEVFEDVRHFRGPFAFSPLMEIGRFRFLNQFLVYIAVLAAGFAREYFVRDQLRGREAAALEARAAGLQAQLADARLDALRMQLNPHFLFNTLHAVSALVERDPAGVRRMIARLSELLRLTIDSRSTNEVTLRQELDFLQRYIEIMEIRFQDRLRVVRTIDEAVLDALVPNLVLQPIVENALEHGASRTGGEGRIDIRAERVGDQLLLSVRDNGPGPVRRNESGVGLANTRARLERLYGNRATLTLTSAEGGGGLARITIPYRTAAEKVHEGLRDE
jgi:two-component system LytT family sensor kinase